jgi:hypothetical protein
MASVPRPTGRYASAAYEVLLHSDQPLRTAEVYQQAEALGLLSESKGKTPALTMAATLFSAAKRPGAVFVRCGRGLFAVRCEEQSHGARFEALLRAAATDAGNGADSGWRKAPLVGAETLRQLARAE